MYILYQPSPTITVVLETNTFYFYFTDDNMKCKINKRPKKNHLFIIIDLFVYLFKKKIFPVLEIQVIACGTNFDF